MGTIVVAGMGPLLGLGIAKRFGREGYRVAMIARKAEALHVYEEQLKDLGIEAAGISADLSNPREVERAFVEVRARFGEVDILELRRAVQANFASDGGYPGFVQYWALKPLQPLQ